jgi:hypothetical protein
MSISQAIFKGVIHGRTIELEQELGLPDGQSVTVTVQPSAENQRRLPPGEGIRRSAGGWDDDPEGLDEYLKLLRQQRDQDRPPIEP